VAWGVLGGVGVEGGAAGLEERDVVLCFGGGGGVFPVDVEAVEAPVWGGWVSRDVLRRGLLCWGVSYLS
jgi:hypothetical protein